MIKCHRHAMGINSTGKGIAAFGVAHDYLVVNGLIRPEEHLVPARVNRNERHGTFLLPLCGRC